MSPPYFLGGVYSGSSRLFHPAFWGLRDAAGRLKFLWSMSQTQEGDVPGLPRPWPRPFRQHHKQPALPFHLSHLPGGMKHEGALPA